MKLLRNAFLAVFFISLVAYGVLILANYLSSTVSGAPIPSVPFRDEPATWIPLITAITSLIGVVTTSVINLRKERMESRKLELEMKKMQLEIDQLKKSTENLPGEK